MNTLEAPVNFEGVPVSQPKLSILTTEHGCRRVEGSYAG
jgi:hypothetical protein